MKKKKWFHLGAGFSGVGAVEAGFESPARRVWSPFLWILMKIILPSSSIKKLNVNMKIVRQS